MWVNPKKLLIPFYTFLFAFSVVFVGWCVHAQAQQISLVGNYPLRVPKTVTRVFTPANDNDNNAGINRTDCDNDEQKVQFAFNLPNVSFSTLKLYGKSDTSSCAPASVRTGATGTSPTCHLIASYPVGQVVNRQVVEIEPAQIVAAMLGSKDISGPASVNKKSDCYTNSSMGPTKVYIHVLLFDASEQPVGGGLDGSAANQYENSSIYTNYDINGPQPPTNVTVGAGETILIANWAGANNSSSSDGGTTSSGTTSNIEPDFQNFRAYCFPAQTSSPSTNDQDASPLEQDATTDASETSAPPPAPTGDCPTNIPDNFVQGGLPNRSLESFVCASSNTVSGRLTIENLQNYQRYAIAITAVDRYGNSGPFSNVVCSTPKPVNDFYKNYRNAGGQAGGGYCSLGHTRFSWLPIALLFATCLMFSVRKHLR